MAPSAVLATDLKIMPAHGARAPAIQTCSSSPIVSFVAAMNYSVNVYTMLGKDLT